MVLSQFLFEALCGIILLSEQPCIMRESDGWRSISKVPISPQRSF